MSEVVSIQFREKMKYKKSDIIDLTVQNSQETNVVYCLLKDTLRSSIRFIILYFLWFTEFQNQSCNKNINNTTNTFYSLN